MALRWRREADDAVWRPLVLTECGRFGVLADEGQLLEVVVTHHFLKRVDDLVCLDMPEDIDDFSMLGLSFWIDHIPQSKRFAGRCDIFTSRLPLRFGVYDD